MKVFDLLKTMWPDPELGFISRDKLLNKVRDYGYDISKKQVDAFYKHFEPTQLHTPVKPKVNFSIVGQIGAYQMDLIFYPRYKRQNHGYSGGFIAVGINSRYACAYPFNQKLQKISIQF